MEMAYAYLCSLVSYSVRHVPCPPARLTAHLRPHRTLPVLQAPPLVGLVPCSCLQLLKSCSFPELHLNLHETFLTLSQSSLLPTVLTPLVYVFICLIFHCVFICVISVRSCESPEGRDCMVLRGHGVPRMPGAGGRAIRLGPDHVSSPV